MTRKNIQDYTQMQIERRVLKRLANEKIHPMQSYSEVIDEMISERHKQHGSKEVRR